MSKPDSDIEAGRKLFAQPCVFVAGAPDADALPASKLPEVAFLGRSNVGKSSLINALVGRTRLARVSNTPGRTRAINLFDLGGVLMLADLPGYGYAKVSRDVAQAWQREILAYLAMRANLRRAILLVDARRGFMDSDREVMALLDKAALSYAVALTKADKLKPVALAALVADTEAELSAHPASLAGVHATSAERGLGLDWLRAALAALAGT